MTFGHIIIRAFDEMEKNGSLSSSTRAEIERYSSIIERSYRSTHRSKQNNPHKTRYNQLAGGVIGTAFPTDDLYTGRPFYRTDIGLNCYYDGTRWVSELQTVGGSAYKAINTSGAYYEQPILDDYQIYVETVSMLYRVKTTNDGSNYYTISHTCPENDLAGQSIIHNKSTSTDSPDTWYRMQVTPTTTQTPTSEGLIAIRPVKTGSPGTLDISWSVLFRYIIT